MAVNKPTVKLKNGFFMIDTGGDAKFINYLEGTKEFTQHYSNASVYYCMANRTGCALFKKYLHKHKDKLDIDKASLDVLKNGGIKYVTNFRAPNIKKIPGIDLFEHQTEAVENMLTHSGYCLFLGQGTGKTLIALSFLYNMNRAGLYVVVTPAKVIDQYKSEAKKYLQRDWVILDKLDVVPKDKKVLFVINYESASKLRGHTINVLLLDESHRAKSYSSLINKTLRGLNVGCCYLFTGTPQDKIQSEIMYQLAIINKLFVGGKTLFLNRYFILDDYFNPKKCIRPDEINEMIKSVSTGYETEALVELTDKNVHKVMCGKISDDYKTLAKDKLLIKDGITVVADSDVKARMKLRQLASGFCMSDDGEIIHSSKDKLNELKKLLTKVKHGIIYTNFDQEIKDVLTILTEGVDCEYVNGKSKGNDQKIRDFKDGKYPYLVINAKSGNAGLDLIVTNNIIFYSLPESFIVFDQCQARIRRIGQTKACNYYYLLVPGSIDVDILRALTNKQSYSSKLFKIYEKEIGNE